jgi:uncharacterized protein
MNGLRSAADASSRSPDADRPWHTARVPWLVSDARVFASADIAHDRAARRRGLLRRDTFEGALVLRPCRWVHTIGMRFPIDVAYLDRDGVVTKTIRMQPHRVGIPVWRSAMVVEAEAGAFGRWGLRVGDVIELRDDDLTDAHPDIDP